MQDEDPGSFWQWIQLQGDESMHSMWKRMQWRENIYRMIFGISDQFVYGEIQVLFLKFELVIDVVVVFACSILFTGCARALLGKA